MSALNVLGGIATGYNQSVEDTYRRDEQKFLQQQRQRMLQEQADSDVTKAKLKGIRRPGEYEEEVSMPDMSGRGVTGGLDADAGDVKPVKTKVKRKYTEADQARDIAGVMQGAGDVAGAAAMMDRAHSLGERDYKQRAMDLIRASKSMSKSEFARQAAALKTAAADDVNAFTTVGDNGEVATIYNSKTGEELQIPIQSHEQIARMVMSTLDPQLWVQTEKLGLEGRQVASGEKVAGAAVKRADTEAKDTEARILTMYPAQAANYAASTKLHNVQAEQLVPAQAAAARAEAALRQRQGMEVSKRMQLIDADNKLPEGVKLYLGMLKDTAIKMQAAAAQDPSQARPAAIATARVLREYKKYGGATLASIDEWDASGLPSPSAAARSFIAEKQGRFKPEDIEAKAQQAMQLFGPEYAADFRASLGQLTQPGMVDSGFRGIGQPSTPAVPTTGSRWNQQNDTGMSQWLGGLNRP